MNRPTTLAECFTWMMDNLTEKQLSELRSLPQNEIWLAHQWLAPIVTESLLKDNEGLQERLDETAFCDDPDIAGQIVDAFWDHLQIMDSRT